MVGLVDRRTELQIGREEDHLRSPFLWKEFFGQLDPVVLPFQPNVQDRKVRLHPLVNGLPQPGGSGKGIDPMGVGRQGGMHQAAKVLDKQDVIVANQNVQHKTTSFFDVPKTVI